MQRFGNMPNRFSFLLPMHLHKLLFLFSGLLITVSLCAQNETESNGQIGGTKVFQFLEVPTGARSAALASTPAGGDRTNVETGLIHPSLLNENMHQSIVFQRNSYISDIAFSSFGGVWSLDSLHTLSFGGVMANYGNFTRADELGNDLGSFSVKDIAFQAGYSYQVDSSFSVGTNVKFISSSYDVYQSNGVGVDLSVAYKRVSKDLNMVLTLRNAGKQLKTYTDSVGDFPTNLTFSVYKRLGKSPLRFVVTADHMEKWDLTFEDPNRIVEVDPITGEIVNEEKNGFTKKLMKHMKFGGEVFLSKSIVGRVGYDYRRRQELKIDQKTGASGISWGLAVRLSYFQFSYGRASYHLAAPSNVFSLQWQFGDFLHKKR